MNCSIVKSSEAYFEINYWKEVVCSRLCEPKFTRMYQSGQFEEFCFSICEIESVITIGAVCIFNLWGNLGI